jgi:hypothetical protein
MDLLTTYTHNLELQVITALSLISTVYKSPQHPLSPFPGCCVFNSCSLATAYNSGDSSASRTHVVTLRRISRNRTLSAGLGSSLYSRGAHPTENTASNTPSIVMGSYLAIALISFPRVRIYRSVVQKRPFVYSPIA